MSIKTSSNDLLKNNNPNEIDDEVSIAEPSILKTQDYNVDIYIEIDDWVSKLFARLTVGAGLHFQSANPEILNFWKLFKEKNNPDFIIEEIAYQTAKYGNSIVTLDSYSATQPDIRLTFAEQGWITRISEELFGVSVWKKLLVGDFLNYFVRETWSLLEIRRYFFFQEKLITVGDFVTQLPPEYKIMGPNKIWKASQNGTYISTTNHLGIIPIVEFRMNRRKAGLFMNKKIMANWNKQINQILTETQRDVIATKPRFTFQGLNKEANKALSNTDLNASDVISLMADSRVSNEYIAPLILQARDRFNGLADLLQKQLKIMLYFLGLSTDVSSQSPTTASGEVKEGSSQVRLVRQFRAYFNHDFKELIKKALKVAGIEGDDFTVYLKDNLAESQQAVINQEIQKLQLGLANRAEAISNTEQVDNADGKALAKAIKPPVAEEPKTEQNENARSQNTIKSNR